MLDPILVEIVRNALLMVAQEGGIRAARSAGSAFISQSSEVACTLFDDRARLISQSDVGQLHLSALRVMLQEVLKDHPPETLREGDILISNDPFRGGIHPTDVGAFRPIFHDGRPAFYVGVMMIVSDLGGLSAGGLPANASECFHEGLMIPPTKLYENGRLNEAVAGLVCGNSRTPRKIASDIKGLAAGCNVAAMRMEELIEKYGYISLSETIDELIDYSERRTRHAIETMPDGVFQGSCEIEEDGIEPNKTHHVMVTVTIDGSDVHFDCTGTGPQAAGAINCSYSQSLSCILFAIRCYIDSTIPMNEGVYRAIHTVLPEGSLVNPRRPAACNLRLAVGQALIDSIAQALTPSFPHLETGAPALSNTFNWAGLFPGTNVPFSMVDVLLGPSGARASCDANDGLPYAVQGASGYERNIETYELNSPVIFWRNQLLEDSGGAGKYRGSCGLLREVEFLTDVHLTVRATDRCAHPPRGAAGGLSAAGGGWILNSGTPDEVVLPFKRTNYRAKAGSILLASISGGGGYGDPMEREPQKVLNDVIKGRVSLEAAETLYGVVIAAETETIDVARTEELRRTRKAQS